jgi:putative chitinase
VLVKTLVDYADKLIAAGIRGEPRLTHFLAQVLTETGGLRRLDEDMNYSKARLIEVFRLPPSVAERLARRPREIANYVYGSRLGNYGRETDDGWMYRGSGYIQLTGRYNFRKHGELVGLSLEEQPNLARQPREGLVAAINYWSARRINIPAEAGDVRAVRAQVNPALEGLEVSRLWLRRARSVLLSDGRESLEESEVAEADIDVSNLLRDFGFLPPSVTESAPDDALEQALRAFQKSRSLNESGLVDEDTFYALTDPHEWRNRSVVGPSLDAPSSSGRRAGVIFDIASQEMKALDFSATTATSGTQRGTGSGEMSNGSKRSKADLAMFNEMEPFFAPYEARSGVRDAHDNFVPFSVIEPDTRVVVPITTSLPARAVVQIAFRRGPSKQMQGCTGTMVSRNVVLTAGHCVHGGGGGGNWHHDFVIVPARNAAVAPFGVCKATHLFSVQGWIEAETPEEGRLHDLGAIRLDCNVGDQTGWLATGVLLEGAAGQPVKIHGYPCDKTPAARQWRSDGSIEIITPTKIFYQNDTYGCMSGSPVLSGVGDTLVAVHTNGLHGSAPWNSYNAATRLSEDFIGSLGKFMIE